MHVGYRTISYVSLKQKKMKMPYVVLSFSRDSHVDVRKKNGFLAAHSHLSAVLNVTISKSDNPR